MSLNFVYPFLLTPLREGRPGFTAIFRAEAGLIHKADIDIVISTHAPAGGATRRHNRNRNVAPISTHAPAGGATPQLDAASEIGIISTHAPAGGATIKTIACGTAQKVFLLTPLREGRQPSLMWPVLKLIFLLTPLREGRQKPYRRCPTRIYFYSRPCGRGDKLARFVRSCVSISTHAPAGGATLVASLTGCK